MTKIYIVTDGEYSSYHIVAVYDESHKETAEAHAKVIDGELEEWELNAPIAISNGRAPYVVTYRHEDNDYHAMGFPDGWSDNIDKIRDGVWLIYVYAESPQHAAKIAMERVTHEKAFST